MRKVGVEGAHVMVNRHVVVVEYDKQVVGRVCGIIEAADMELDACPAVNVSYSLSPGFGKPLRPPFLRFVENRSRRPVSSLCP